MDEMCQVYESESKPPPIIRISRKLWQECSEPFPAFASPGDGALSASSSFEQNHFRGPPHGVHHHHHHHHHHHRHDHYHHHLYSHPEAAAASSQEVSDISNASEQHRTKGKRTMKQSESDMSLVQSLENTASSTGRGFLSSLSPVPHARDSELPAQSPMRAKPSLRTYACADKRVALAERVSNKPSSWQRPRSSNSHLQLAESIRSPLAGGLGVRLANFIRQIGGQNMEEESAPSISQENEGADEPEELEYHGLAALEPELSGRAVHKTSMSRHLPRPERQRDPERLVT
eukprot:1513596-Rhodomonas_salina.3